MHHTFGSVKGDTLCPLGFHPQVRWPTRCKRCFRDYKDHSGKRGSLKADITSSTPSLSRWEPSPSRSSESPETKRTWASTSNLAKDENQLKTDSNNTHTAATEWSNSAMDIPSLVESSPKSWQSETSTRPKSYVGSQSDSYTFRRHSVDETALQTLSTNEQRPAKLQIKQVIDKSPESSDNNVEFIIQVRKTKDHSIGDGVDNNGGKGEIERLKVQLNEMKARCERVEREKSEILLRRLTTMDSVSAKTSKSTEVTRLQKSLKELQSKNEALNEERTELVLRLKSLEKESGTRGNVKNERERASEELKSKLKAAETLCESLMDENEDMKKEIRELEEEIYEMQDNFREEQADEYTSLRKSLEQSNKNCRILSFKLRKLERKTEQMENDKTELENKYEEIKKLEEVLKKLTNDFKNRGMNKTTENTTKMQMKRMLDEAKKELGEVYEVFVNIINASFDSPNLKAQDNSTNDKLVKEKELLQQKLDNAIRELTKEREINKSTNDSSLKNDAQNLKKKLNEAIIAREAEKKSWELEKSKLQDEKEKLKSKLLSLSAEKLKVYNEVLQLKKDLEVVTSTEKNNITMETTVNELRKELNAERDRCKKLQDDLSTSTERESRMSKTLNGVEQIKAFVEGELKRTRSELENTKSSTSMKIAKMTAELAEVKKERDKIKTQADDDKLIRDNEIGSLKKKISALEKAGANAKKMTELKQTYTEKITILEDEMKKGQERFDDLHTKHAALQDAKRKVESEVETLNSELLKYKKKYETIEKRLHSLEEDHKLKESTWLKENTRLEEMLRERERSTVIHQYEEAKEQVNRLSKENESLRIQLNDTKKSNDDLASKLNDFNAVTKVQRNLSADTSALESELRKAKSALDDVEKARKSDVAQCKMRYECRIKAINDEIQSIQNQLSRYKRERDTYKHMLEGAQRTIAELKVTRQRRPSTTSTGKSDEDEESTGTNVSTLERQISMMEDELSESKLESSKLKTELVSERSGWQIKLSELQSRINELEEERILASGRTKIPGLRARIELAWQKEREEQQRLLQETATLARDLRQTLYEVERERDKERLENKRRQEQTKKIFDEEKEENKKKLIELQCDLLELRDAHAKLRTSNEKMRREKERHEREREELKDLIASKRRVEQTEAKNMNILLRQVEDLLKLFPELSSPIGNGNKMPDNYTPTPPRRMKGPKSRESSPMLESKDDFKDSSNNLNGKTEKLEYTIKKLIEVAKELQESKKILSGNYNSEKKKLSKRSSSIDDDSGRGSSSSRTKSSLKRKSLSLEQTSGKNDQLIWRTDSNVSSMQSLDSEVDPRHYSLQRDSSVDSRLSGGSTKSEMIHRDKKYNKNLIRKIATKLTKSASVDDPNNSYEFSVQTSGSEASIVDDGKIEKKNLKKKFSDMFKRGSKSNGLDKKLSSDDISRPASRASNVA